MFQKVLVANRGEIAVRVLRACSELGLETVAVYSEVDRGALHVRYANEAYPIGPAPARDSYLRIDKLIDVAKRAQVDAIHPGYGFLAENPAFARACAEAGIAFVGPSAEAIAAMGDKLSAKLRMKAAGVPIIPGTEAGLGDAEMIAAVKDIGLPVFIKAAAGGGGKGIRLVRAESELPDALAAARRETMAAFGDNTLYLEKAITEARHVEIQVLADSYGNVVHLGERECSIQRRHQKLIEESPSVIVDEDMRQEMGQIAVQAAKSIGYVNAGTLEFLVDRERNFYFLEMNTRLQVEHAVTEFVTGVDIVKEQLRVASGRRLRYNQEDIKLSGHSIECRITSEDPYANFMPSTGRITALFEPTGPGVRVESGVGEGFEVSLYYDPLLAKLVVIGETRAEAILRMRRALSEFRIIGVRTTIPFHQRVMDSTSFIAGRFDTNFVEQRFSMRAEEKGDSLQVAAIAAALVAHQRRQQALILSPKQTEDSRVWRLQGRLEGRRR
ncbi:MAG: acetyl-CoA carboxylase biotin carboxylase subunit [Chloroflexi bacterium]|nr:acetyl-CoA carboxylase biotin carboxylase subunit [Chloroflexota bacterium]